MRLFGLDSISLWGDFGDLLMHGCGYRNEFGQFEVSRTGPFVPPVTQYSFYQTIVVTEATRDRLLSAGFSLPPFQEVAKKHIGEFHWKHWDRTQELPLKDPPPMKEIEDLIFGIPHSDAVAAQMGTLWECGTEPDTEGPTERINERSYRDYDIALKSNTNTFRRDFFGGFHDIIVSERLKCWLQKEAGEWLTFRDVLISEL